jgi:hypothetical protein
LSYECGLTGETEAALRYRALIAALGAALLSAQAGAAELSQSEAKAGKDAIELHYINQKIYKPVICEEREVDGTTFVNCGPSRGGVDGGLWAIEAGPTVLAVNGKALQHADGIGTVIFDADGKQVKFAEWRKVHQDKPVNVIEVMKVFQ